MTGYTNWVREIEILKGSALTNEELELARASWQAIPDQDKDSAYHLDNAAADVARQCHYRSALHSALAEMDKRIGVQLSSHAAEFTQNYGRQLARAALDAFATPVARGRQFWIHCFVAVTVFSALVSTTFLLSYFVLLSRLYTGGLRYPDQTETQRIAAEVGAVIVATGSTEEALWVANHVATPGRIARVDKYLADIEQRRDPYLEVAKLKLCLGVSQHRAFAQDSVTCTFTVVTPTP